MRFSLSFPVFLLVSVAAFGANLAQEADEQRDFEVGVVLDTAEQTGSASAKVRIHAPRELVWSLITNCAEALKMVPGLVSCDVLETAADKSWQRIRQVVDYSWYVRKLTYEVIMRPAPPVEVSIERVSGDLSTLKASWTLNSEGDYTVAHYAVELAPGFWVPHWVVRLALRRDLPKMMRALRTRAEFVAHP